MSASRQSDRLSNSAVVHPVASGDTALVNGVASRDRTSSLGKEEVVKMNLMAIRKIDSQVETICSTVPKVVLYQYDGANNTWVSDRLPTHVPYSCIFWLSYGCQARSQDFQKGGTSMSDVYVCMHA